ncbi:MAG: hypothetical protein AB7I18_07760 [Candidatus Berkiella sp.]
MPKFKKDEKDNSPSGPIGIHKPPRRHHTHTETQRVQRYIDGTVVAGTIPPARQIGHNRTFVPAAAPAPTPAIVHTQTFIPATAQTPGFIPPARIAGTPSRGTVVHQQAFVPTPAAFTPALFLAATQAPLLGQLAQQAPSHAAVTQTTTRLQPSNRH